MLPTVGQRVRYHGGIWEVTGIHKVGAMLHSYVDTDSQSSGFGLPYAVDLVPVIHGQIQMWIETVSLYIAWNLPRVRVHHA